MRGGQDFEATQVVSNLRVTGRYSSVCPETTPVGVARSSFVIMQNPDVLTASGYGSCYVVHLK